MTAVHRVTVHPLAAQLRGVRIDSGLKLRALARRLGKHPSTVSHWELGNNMPPLDEADAWATALGFDLTLTPKERTTAA